MFNYFFTIKHNDPDPEPYRSTDPEQERKLNSIEKELDPDLQPWLTVYGTSLYFYFYN